MDETEVAPRGAPSDLADREDYLAELSSHAALYGAHSALVIVDMQYATASWEAGLGKIEVIAGRACRVQWRLDRVEQVVIPAIYRMLGVYRECRRPIVYVKTGSQLPDFSDLPAYYRGIQEHVKNKVGEPEFEIRREIAPRPIDPVIVKSTISAFKSTGIGTLLRSLDVDQAVFCGVSTNSCVDSTARDAAELGFEAIMVEDACSAANGSYHAAALTTFGRLFGSVTSSEHVCSVVAARNE